MKYAIVESGGKQYKAVEGKTIEVDRLHVEAGKKLNLTEVLLYHDGKKAVVGTPLVKGVKVNVTVVEQIKAPKILVFKYKSRQRYRVKSGHRQKYTRLMINKITKAAKKKPAETKAEKKPAASKAE
jgi:large subunit ribosomal protein L21